MKKSKNNLKELISLFPVTDYLEAGIDSVIEDGLAKDIPIVGSFLAFGRLADNVKKARTTKKIRSFLEGADDITHQEIELFKKKFEESDSDDDLSDIFENLILLIDQIESEQKAKIIGSLFKLLILGKIQHDLFNDLAFTTKNIYITDIHLFMHGYHNEHTYKDGLGDKLVSFRLLKKEQTISTKAKGFGLKPEEIPPYIETKYSLTNVGMIYLAALHCSYKEYIEPERLVTI